MKYYNLDRYTDWQVMYAPLYMDSEEYKDGRLNKINNTAYYEDAPIIPCRLIHEFEDYRNIDWEEEGKEEPPLEPPLLKDVIQRSGMLSFNGIGGIVISQKFKEALDRHVTDKHFFYKFQLEYQGKHYDYYFLIPNIQEPYKYIDFTKTEFLTKPQYSNYNRKTRRRELLKPSEVVKVQNLDEFLKIKDKLQSFVYNNKILYINKKLDFFLNGGSTYFVSERFKSFIEKEGLEVTISELSPAGNVSTIIAPEEV